MMITRGHKSSCYVQTCHRVVNLQSIYLLMPPSAYHRANARKITQTHETFAGAPLRGLNDWRLKSTKVKRDLPPTVCRSHEIWMHYM